MSQSGNVSKVLVTNVPNLQVDLYEGDVSHRPGAELTENRQDEASVARVYEY